MTTSYCTNCGQQLSSNDQFCARCGTETIARTPNGGAQAQGCPNCAAGVDLSRSFCDYCGQVFVAPGGVKIASQGRRVGAYALDIVLFIVTLIIGYIIWWLFTLRRGQTPGKRLLGLQVIRVDGTASDWGWTFLREFVVKGIGVGVLNSVVGVVWIIDLLWVFWDKDRQTIHDKIMRTLVIDDREFRAEANAEHPADFEAA